MKNEKLNFITALCLFTAWVAQAEMNDEQVCETTVPNTSFQLEEVQADDAVGALFKSFHDLMMELYDEKKGVQAEYEYDPRNLDAERLAKYNRSWVYTQGIALERAVREGRGADALAMAEWLYQHFEKVELPGGQLVFGGWPFSQNTLHDSYKDPRYVTGANAWAMYGLGSFIVSPFFDSLEEAKKKRLRRFYEYSLEGILHCQRGDGLVSAGWTIQPLIDAPIHRYYDVLDKQGYQRGLVKVPSRNVVTEHNVDVLNILEAAVEHARPLGIDRARYARSRDLLQDAIFSRLYIPEDGRFATGLVVDEQGERPSEHTAVDNASWLALYVSYEHLTPERIDKIARALHYTCRHFIKNFEKNGETFYGAHYFTKEFSDPYVAQDDGQEDAYHLEATGGLILGLCRFADNNPAHPCSVAFREMADALWVNLQVFTKKHGLPYASKPIKNLLTSLNSSASVIWCLDVYDYYDGRRPSRWIY